MPLLAGASSTSGLYQEDLRALHWNLLEAVAAHLKVAAVSELRRSFQTFRDGLPVHEDCQTIAPPERLDLTKGSERAAMSWELSVSCAHQMNPQPPEGLRIVRRVLPDRLASNEELHPALSSADREAFDAARFKQRFDYAL
jgi:hypothetical protein